MLKILPNYKGGNLSGNKFNLYSGESVPITLAPGGHQRQLICTGLEATIPPNRLILINGSSGFYHTHGVALLSPFVIDENTFGEIKVVLTNMGDKPYVITPGAKIAEASIIRTGGI